MNLQVTNTHTAYFQNISVCVCVCAHFHPCSNFVDQFWSRLTAFKPHKEMCKPQCSSPHKEGVQPKIKNYQSPHCEKEGSMGFLFMRHL